MTGFIGGTVGELPGISEAMGPVAEGLGQIVEGAIDGEVGFKQMAVAGAGMGVVAGLLLGVQKIMSSIAETKAFREEQIDGYTEAIKELGDTTTSLTEQLRDAAKIEFRDQSFAGYFGGLIEHTSDAKDDLDDLNISFETFAQLVKEGRPAVDEYIDSTLQLATAYGTTTIDGVEYNNNEIDINRTLEAQDNVAKALRQSTDAYGKAQSDAAFEAAFFRATQAEVNETLDEFIQQQDPIAAFPAEFGRMATALANGVAPAAADVNRISQGLNVTVEEAIDLAYEHADVLGDTEDALSDLEAATADFREEVDAAVDALEAENEALYAKVDAARSSADGMYALRDAEDAFAGALAGADEAVTAADGDLRQIRQVYDGVAESAIGVADAQVRIAADAAAQSGAVLSASEANRIFQQSMIESAMSANGTYRPAILEAIAATNGIPVEKVTQIFAENPDASLETIQGEIDALSTTSSALIEADANTEAANDLLEEARAAERTAEIIAEALTDEAEADLQAVQDAERFTEIVAQAATDVAEGDFADSEDAERFTDIEAVARLAGFDAAMVNATQDRYTNIYVRTIPIGEEPRDRGGRIPAGSSAVIAEKRPEVYKDKLYTEPTVVAGGGNVTSGQATAALMKRSVSGARPSAGSTVVDQSTQNTYVTVGPGYRPSDIADLERRYRRRTGRK